MGSPNYSNSVKGDGQALTPFEDLAEMHPNIQRSISPTSRAKGKREPLNKFRGLFELHAMSLATVESLEIPTQYRQSQGESSDPP